MISAMIRSEEKHRSVFAGARVWLHGTEPNAASRDLLVEGGRIKAIEAAGFEGVGGIAQGAQADWVWLEQDPGLDPEKWREARVDAVWRDGVQILG